jgi:hypothetical protein
MKAKVRSSGINLALYANREVMCPEIQIGRTALSNSALRLSEALMFRSIAADMRPVLVFMC